MIPVHSHDIPRWEDIDLDSIDYDPTEIEATGKERTLRSLRSQIDSSEAVLRRYLRELGVSPGGDPVRATIPSHLCSRDPFAFDRARKARSAQSNLESRRRRFCHVYAEHRILKDKAENSG